MIMLSPECHPQFHAFQHEVASADLGFENIKNYDANGLFAPVTVTAKDHGGGGKTRIEMWDGSKWVPQTDWIGAYNDIVWEVVKESSKSFKSE